MEARESQTDAEAAVVLPRDADGFLRRECPECEREFKWTEPQDIVWIPSPDPSAPPWVETPDGPSDGYACPYCEHRAQADQWYTKPQVAYIDEVGWFRLYDDALRGHMERIRNELEAYQTPFFAPHLVADPPQEPALVEPGDMRRVDFDCHPDQPVKIRDDWAERVYCLICGAPTAPQSAPAA